MNLVNAPICPSRFRKMPSGRTDPPCAPNLMSHFSAWGVFQRTTEASLTGQAEEKKFSGQRGPPQEKRQSDNQKMQQRGHPVVAPHFGKILRALPEARFLQPAEVLLKHFPSARRSFPRSSQSHLEGSRLSMFPLQCKYNLSRPLKWLRF